MSDKEFDQQFRGKFEDFEITPSPMVWEGINKHISGNQRKAFPLLKFAAASIAAIMAIGLWFAPHKEPMKLYGKKKVEEVGNPVSTESGFKDAPIVAFEEEAEDVLEYKPITPRRWKSLRREVRNDELVQANNDTENQSAVQQIRNEVIELIEKPTYTANTGEAYNSRQTRHEIIALNEDAGDTTTDKSRHRIKSLGDLVNFVVGRVDKRKNKIIEFSKDDEGEEISGLNLGVLQYKTRAN